VAGPAGLTAGSEWPEKRAFQLAGASVKRALDTEWSDPNAKDEALNTLVRQLDSLDAWLRQSCRGLRKPPLKEPSIHGSDRPKILSLTPTGRRRHTRIREGVCCRPAHSIEDRILPPWPQNKSSVHGYKRASPTDLDTDLILACAVPARPTGRGRACARLQADLERQRRRQSEMHIDRATLPARCC